MRERSPMTCLKSSSRTALRSAAMLFLPLGGKTSPWGDGRSIFALPWNRRPSLNDVCAVALAQRQITMGQHDQSNMTVQASPTPSLIMIKPQFPLGVLIESLDNPTDMRKFNQLFQVESVQVPSKIIFTIVLTNGLGDGTLTQKPTSNGQVGAPIATAKHFYPGKLLYERPLCTRAPRNPLPGFGGQLLEYLCGLYCRNALFNGRSLSGLTASTVRRRWWVTLILINRFGMTESDCGAHRRDTRHFQSNQTIEQRRLVPITSIDHHRPKGNLFLERPVNQLHADLTFGLKPNRFRHMGLFSPHLVFGPTFGQIQTGRYRPVKNGIDIMGSHKNLAIINPAQGSAVLPGNSYGSGTFFSKAGVVKNQHPVTGTCVGQHMLSTKLIHLPRVPFGTSKKFLQPLAISVRQRSAEFRGCFSACARQKSCGVALKCMPALRSAQELTKRRKELSKINQWL